MSRRREFNTAHPCLMPRHEYREWPHVPERRSWLSALRRLVRRSPARQA